MLNTKEQINSTEMDMMHQEPLFTELAPEAAAVVEGGLEYLDEKVNFDFYRPTLSFKVQSGTNIVLSSNVSSVASNKYFSARVTNVNTGRSTRTQLVPTDAGKVATIWTNMKAGTYRVELRDEKDRKKVKGEIRVVYNWI